MTVMATPLRSVPESVPRSRTPWMRTPRSGGFFDAERTSLFGALAVMTGNRAEAEEVMQDAFLRVWERWDRVSEMESPEGFLYRTALNVYRRRLHRAAIAVTQATTLLPRGRYVRRRRDTRRGRPPASVALHNGSARRSW